jgi:hypothetical protein
MTDTDDDKYQYQICTLCIILLDLSAPVPWSRGGHIATQRHGHGQSQSKRQASTHHRAPTPASRSLPPAPSIQAHASQHQGSHTSELLTAIHSAGVRSTALWPHVAHNRHRCAVSSRSLSRQLAARQGPIPGGLPTPRCWRTILAQAHPLACLPLTSSECRARSTSRRSASGLCSQGAPAPPSSWAGARRAPRGATS